MSRIEPGRIVLAAGEGRALRRAQAARARSTAGRCSSTRWRRCSPCRRSTPWSSCSARTPTRSARRPTCAAPRSSSARTGPTGQSASLRARRWPRSATSTRPWSSARPTSRSSRRRRSPASLDLRGRHVAVRATYDGAPGHPVLLGRRAARPRRRAARATPACATCCSASTCDVASAGRPLADPTDIDTPERARGPADEARAVVRGGTRRSTQVWAALIDLERVAPCLPGAAITEPRRRRHLPRRPSRSSSARRPRPTAARSGSTSADEATHTATLKARGTDKRGQGGAERDDRQHAHRGTTARTTRRGRHRLHDHRPPRRASAAAA